MVVVGDGGRRGVGCAAGGCAVVVGDVGVDQFDVDDDVACSVGSDFRVDFVDQFDVGFGFFIGFEHDGCGSCRADFVDGFGIAADGEFGRC